MTSGVYAIFLEDSNFVYVGESKNIEARYNNHLRDWIWPNKHMLQILEELPNTTRAQRLPAETKHTQVLRSQRFLLLSTTSEEMIRYQRANKNFSARADATCRKRYGENYRTVIALKAGETRRRKSPATVVEEKKQMWRTRVKKYGPCGHSSAGASWDTRRQRKTPEQIRETAKAAGLKAWETRRKNEKLKAA